MAPARRPELASQFDELSQMLESSMEAMAHGFVLVGLDGRVKLCNRRALEMLNIPDALLRSKPMLHEIMEFQARRGDFGSALEHVEIDARAHIADRGRRLDETVPGKYIRRTPEGKYIEVRTMHMPSGDIVRTYSDVTSYELANRELKALLVRYEEIKARDLENAREGMLAGLSELASHRDNETGRHILRTQLYLRVLAVAVAESGKHAKELTSERIEQIVKAAPMHDLGKIGIPDAVLRKAGHLTPDERQVMHRHAEIGESALAAVAADSDAERSVLALASRIAGGHHENWDGSGYPRGVAGDQIPLEARLMSVADVYDALTTPRVYKPAWTHDAAAQEIQRERGRKFDPDIVDAFMREQEAFKSIALKFVDSL